MGGLTTIRAGEQETEEPHLKPVKNEELIMIKDLAAVKINNLVLDSIEVGSPP